MILSRLASWCSRHRLLVVAVWAAVLVGGVAGAPALFSRLGDDVGTIDSSDSSRAAQQLFAAAPSGGSLYAVLDGRPAVDETLAEDVAELSAELENLDGVVSVATPWSTGDPGMVAEDGTAVVLAVTLATTADAETVESATGLIRAFEAPRVLLGGGVLQDFEMANQAAQDLVRAEQLSLPVALVLLVVFFGGVVVAGIPVLIALVGMGATLLTLLGFSAVGEVSVYAVNVVTMLGLGLAVDYALLVVSRYREERASGDPSTALERTFATAGRTVAFSGLTVAASLAGLLVFPDDFLRSMGVAGLSVVLLDLLAALTLLPAILSFLDARIRPAPVRHEDRGALVSLARWVRRRPLPVALAVCAVLLLSAAPFLGARYAQPDHRSLPEASPSRQLAEVVQSRFRAGGDVDPVTLVAQEPVAPAALASYTTRLRALDGVVDVRVRSDVPGLTVVDVVPSGESQGSVALRLVEEARELAAPVPVLVTGDAAELIDYQAAIADRLPWMLTVIAVATFVLLFLFTGSVVVPLKALVLTVLSLGASFGALVWVFQDGHLGDLVGTEALGSLSVTTPVLVLAIAFGLSMDYEVFLLGRMTERYRRTGDNELAVEQGLQRTGGIVTAAAVLIIVIFAGFVAGGFSPVKQVGLGLALAVAVDATLVRLLLLPAVMSLMGHWNWWAPAPLRRLHDRIGMTEGGPASQPVAAPGHRALLPALSGEP